MPAIQPCGKPQANRFDAQPCSWISACRHACSRLSEISCPFKGVPLTFHCSPNTVDRKPMIIGARFLCIQDSNLQPTAPKLSRCHCANAIPAYHAASDQPVKRAGAETCNLTPLQGKRVRGFRMAGMNDQNSITVVALETLICVSSSEISFSFFSFISAICFSAPSGSTSSVVFSLT